jgi:hypothetical protein
MGKYVDYKHIAAPHIVRVAREWTENGPERGTYYKFIKANGRQGNWSAHHHAYFSDYYFENAEDAAVFRIKFGGEVLSLEELAEFEKMRRSIIQGASGSKFSLLAGVRNATSRNR